MVSILDNMQVSPGVAPEYKRPERNIKSVLKNVSSALNELSTEDGLGLEKPYLTAEQASAEMKLFYWLTNSNGDGPNLTCAQWQFCRVLVELYNLRGGVIPTDFTAWLLMRMNKHNENGFIKNIFIEKVSNIKVTPMGKAFSFSSADSVNRMISVVYNKLYPEEESKQNPINNIEKLNKISERMTVYLQDFSCKTIELEQ